MDNILVMVIAIFVCFILGLIFRGLDNAESDAFQDFTGVRRSHATGRSIGQRSASGWANAAGVCHFLMFASVVILLAMILSA